MEGLGEVFLIFNCIQNTFLKMKFKFVYEGSWLFGCSFTLIQLEKNLYKIKWAPTTPSTSKQVRAGGNRTWATLESIWS